VGVLLGLVAAVLYGSGDFLGGRASEQADTRRVLLVSQTTAAVGAVLLVVLVDGSAGGADLLRGAAAGVATALGLGLLYRGLAVGRASVVAPIAAVVGAVVPVVWGVTRDEHPSVLAWVGIGVAICAAGLVARERDDGTAAGRPSGIGLAAVAGAALGSSFILLASTSPGSGAWPILTARVGAAVAAAGAVATIRERAAWPRGRPLAFGVVAGVCDVGGTGALLAGVRNELAAIVAAVAALAPGFTVLWSFVVLRERLRPAQLAGVGLALAGLVTIAAS
jgi:drug/metabolite transporter (DMT)-like permease